MMAMRAGLVALGLVLAPVLVAAPAHAEGCAEHTVGQCAADQPHSDGATAQCADGSISYSEHFSGTCSGHGGVQRWFKEPGDDRR